MFPASTNENRRHIQVRDIPAPAYIADECDRAVLDARAVYKDSGKTEGKKEILQIKFFLIYWLLRNNLYIDARNQERERERERERE